MAMTGLLDLLEDTSGDQPIIPHTHSGLPAPKMREWTLTEKERRYGKAWVAECRRALRAARTRPN
jgi:hypothetical protein